MPIQVSTHVGDSLVEDWVYRPYVMIFMIRETWVDLVVLDIVDFMSS